MIIVDARFGKYDKLIGCDSITQTSQNVSQKISGLVDSKTKTINWRMKHAHKFFDDPLPGVRKAVKIRYRTIEGGKILTACFPETDDPNREIHIQLL